MQAVELVFRHEYGRIVAQLTRTYGLASLERAEDAVQMAMVQALKRWPTHGTPQNAAAWLFEVSRNALIDALRRDGKQTDMPDDLAIEGMQDSTRFDKELGDDELALLFAICEPTLPIQAQIALALKALCGFSLGEIAAGLLTNESALAQRLARARKQITAHQIRLEVPAPADLPVRRAAVMSALYLMFNEGFHSVSDKDLMRPSICLEAIRLTRLLASHPGIGTPEAHALAALLLLHGARIDGRIDAGGEFVLLRDQPRERWNQSMIALGMQHLDRARAGPLTSYHLQAGIASEHACATDFANTDWHTILGYYTHLIALDPTPVVQVGHAIGSAQVHGPQAGIDLVCKHLAALTAIRYPYGHVALADWLHEIGEVAQARQRYQEAITLARSENERLWIERKLRQQFDHTPRTPYT